MKEPISCSSGLIVIFPRGVRQDSKDVKFLRLSIGRGLRCIDEFCVVGDFIMMVTNFVILILFSDIIAFTIKQVTIIICHFWNII